MVSLDDLCELPSELCRLPMMVCVCVSVRLVLWLVLCVWSVRLVLCVYECEASVVCVSVRLVLCCNITTHIHIASSPSTSLLKPLVPSDVT